MRRYRRRKPRWGRIFAAFAVFAGIAAGSIYGLLYFTALPDEPVIPAMAGTQSPSLPPEETPSPTATSTPTQAPTPEPLGKVSIRMRAIGDLMNHDQNLEAAKTGGGYDFTSVFEAIAPSLQAADLTIGNLETTVSGEKSEIDDSYFTGYPAFRSPASYLDALKSAGFDALTLANNHMLDKGFLGVTQTVAALEDKNIPYAGAYATEEASNEILIMDVQGVNIAILAYAEYANATTDKPFALNYLKEEAVNRDAALARDQGADIVVAVVHWGTEYSTTESQNQQLWANRISKAGVDIIIGSHPHVVQPAGWLENERADGSIQRTFVAYSLGNFISNQRTQPRDAGVIFDFEIEKDLETGECAVIGISYIPTWVFKVIEGNKPTFAVLPAGKYREAEYPGLTGEGKSRLNSVWNQTVALLESSGATVLTE